MISRELMMMSVCVSFLSALLLSCLAFWLFLVFFSSSLEIRFASFSSSSSPKRTRRARATTVSEKHDKKERERDFVFVFVFVFFESPRFRQSSLATKEEKKEKSSPLFSCEKKTTMHALHRVLCVSSTSRRIKRFSRRKRDFLLPFERTEKR